MVWAGEERMRDGWMGGLVVGGMGGFKGWFHAWVGGRRDGWV